jgi:eukaryotic-like serine/threonine-protein kinase
MSLHLTAEAATQAWDELAERLERFIQTWEQGQEPTISPFLPAEPPAMRRLVLIELIKVDLEQRTTRGRGLRLEHYAKDYPELLEDGEPPCDLIYEEYHIRRTAGQEVSPQDYYKRFPKSAAALRRMMGADVSVSTQLVSTRRIEGFTPGQRLDDFDLLVELGKGAFGSVFLARQISMQRLVALKVSADKGTESQTLAALDHPNIIRVFDQRRLPEHRVRLMYMQYAPGGTLADVVKLVRATPPAARTGKILADTVSTAAAKAGFTVGEDAAWKRRSAATGWPETVCRLGIQLAQALDHAHKQGVLHRDVKPANVLLATDGSPKLADFNISFCSQLDGASPAAYFGGSLAYMSPEQLEACNPSHEREAKDLDGRSDLYGLAVVLWELLYGERPFADDEITGAWSRMLESMTKMRRSEQPQALTPSRDPVAFRLEKVLRKALSPDPAQRQPAGATLARELALGLNPRAWDLVNDLNTGWRDWAKRHPLWALFPVNLPPFLLAGILNLWYNWSYLVPNFPDFKKDEETGEVVLGAMGQAFVWMTPPVNICLYSLGVALVLWFAWPVARALGRLKRGELNSDEQLRAARHRAITLGHGVAIVGMMLWMVAGISFPIGIHLLVGHFAAKFYLMFLISMFACGIISSCLPFLATTWLSVRIFFPTLLANSTPDPEEQRRLTTLGRQSAYYFLASPVAPLIAILLILSSGNASPFAISILIGTSLIGLGFAYFGWQLIRGDLTALSIVTRPPDMIGTTTDTVDTF